MNKKESLGDVLFLAAGETVTAGLVILGAFIISLFTDYAFDYTAVTGAVLGAAVATANFLFLTLSVNSAVDSYLKIRGNREMTEEEAEKFTAEHSQLIQNRIKTSYIIRTFSILAVLVIAFLTRLFNPLCTVIPMLAGQFIINLGEIIRKRKDKVPNPDNFVKYDKEEE